MAVVCGIARGAGQVTPMWTTASRLRLARPSVNFNKARRPVSREGQSLRWRGYGGIAVHGKYETCLGCQDTKWASLDPAIVAKSLRARAAALKPPVAPIKPPVVAKKGTPP